MQKIIICTNFRPQTTQPSCAFRGSKELAAYLEKEILARNLDVEIERTVCLGHCPKGPNVRLLGGPFIHEANEDKLDTLMNEITDQTNMKNKTI